MMSSIVCYIYSFARTIQSILYENVSNAINYLLTLAPTHNSSNTSHIKFSFSDNLILLRILSAYIDVIYFLTKMIGC